MQTARDAAEGNRSGGPPFQGRVSWWYDSHTSQGFQASGAASTVKNNNLSGVEDKPIIDILELSRHHRPYRSICPVA